MAQPGPAPTTAPTRITITYVNGVFGYNPPHVHIPNGGSVDFNGGTGVTGCTVCFSPTNVFGASTNVSPGNNPSLTAQQDNVSVSYTIQNGLNANCPQLAAATKEKRVGNGGGTITVGQ